MNSALIQPDGGVCLLTCIGIQSAAFSGKERRRFHLRIFVEKMCLLRPAG